MVEDEKRGNEARKAGKSPTELKGGAVKKIKIGSRMFTAESLARLRAGARRGGLNSSGPRPRRGLRTRKEALAKGLLATFQEKLEKRIERIERELDIVLGSDWRKT